MKERVTLTLDSDLLKDVDRKVDGFKIKNRSHAIEMMLMQVMGNSIPKTALILAGGKGVRLQPITHEIPKPLMLVHDRTLLEHSFDLFKKFNIKNVVLSVGYKGDKIKEVIGSGRRFGVNVEYVEESKPMGTGGAIKLCASFLKDTFVCCNADELKDLDLLDMYLAHKEHKATVTIALTSVDDPSMYGVARLQGNRILEFVEKPKKENAPSKLINSGLYMMEPEVFDYIPAGKEVSLEKEVFPKLAKEGKLFGYPFSGQWLNTGTMELYEEAIKKWKDIA